MRSTDHATRFRPGVEAASPRAFRALSVAVVAAFLSLLLTFVDDERAHAASYPSWQDVQNAKSNEGATAEKITQITTLIDQLEADSATAEQVSRARGADLERAQLAFDEADLRARQLQDQAERARRSAEKSRVRAGRLAAQLHRTGNNDVTVSLLLSAVGTKTAEPPEALLARLSSTAELIRTSSRIYEQVRTAENTVDALARQADAAKAVREKRRGEAEKALAAARSAATAVQADLERRSAQAEVLRAQLAALKDTTAKTVSAYQAGVEEERRKAAEAAKNAGQGPASGGSVGPQGWAVPANGRITSPFGARTQPCSNCTSYHRGVDIGASCNAPIRAAYPGTVVYAGPQGTYGNFVLIDHGVGISTGYAHIATGGILVGIGSRVSAGQQIARVGSTGASTGCHLHYEVRVGGVTIDPVPFMRQRGVPLG